MYVPPWNPRAIGTCLSVRLSCTFFLPHPIIYYSLLSFLAPMRLGKGSPWREDNPPGRYRWSNLTRLCPQKATTCLYRGKEEPMWTPWGLYFFVCCCLTKFSPVYANHIKVLFLSEPKLSCLPSNHSSLAFAETAHSSHPASQNAFLRGDRWHQAFL